MTIRQICRHVYCGACATVSVLLRPIHYVYRPLFSQSKTTTTRISVRTSYCPVVHRIQISYSGGIADIGYADVGPRDGPVVLALHGAPGSVNDFADLYEPLSAVGIRLIVPEFPGYCNSEISCPERFDESTKARANLILTFLNEMGINSVAAVIGHSLGTAAAFDLAASTNIFQSVVYLNGIGFVPHKTIRPFWIMRLLAWLMLYPTLEKLMSGFLLRGYRSRGLTVNSGDGLTAALVSVTRADFNQFKKNVETVRIKNIPLIFALTKNDKLVEWQLQLDVTKHAGVSEGGVTELDAGKNVITGPSPNADVYPKALVFERGGHFVQRSQTEIIAQSVIHLIYSVQPHYFTSLQLNKSAAR